MKIYQRIIFILGTILVIFIFRDCASSSKVMTSKLIELKPQMTKDEVIAVLGKPKYIRKKIVPDIYEVWEYDLYDNDGYRREYLFYFDKNDKLNKWNEKIGFELMHLYSY